METLTQATTETKTANFWLRMPKHILAAFLTVPPKGRKAVLVITEGVKIAVSGDNIRIQATDLDTTAYWDEQRTDDTGGNFMFVVKTDFLQHFTKGPQQFEYNQAERWVKVAGFKYPTDDATDFPAIPMHPTGMPFDIDPAQVTRMLQIATTDQMRPAMTGINIGPELCTSDGHRLIMAPGHETRPFILPNSKFWAKLKTAYITPGVKLTPAGETVVSDFIQVTSEKLNFLIRRIPAQYPDFKAVIPTEPPHYIDVSGKQLFDSLNFILPASNKTTQQIFIDILQHSIKVHTYDIDMESEAKSIINGTDTNRPGLQITFNGKYLASLLKDAKAGELVRLNFCTPTKPFTFHIAGETRLIMPIVIYNEFQHEKKAPAPGIDRILPIRYNDYLIYGEAGELTTDELAECDKLSKCIGSTANPLYKYDEQGNRKPATDKIYTFANPMYQP